MFCKIDKVVYLVSDIVILVKYFVVIYSNLKFWKNVCCLFEKMFVVCLFSIINVKFVCFFVDIIMVNK